MKVVTLWTLSLLLVFLQLATTKSDCSGNGLVFPDTGLCNCWNCWTGENCETLIDPCIINDSGGNPLVYQNYWENKPKEEDILVESDYRTGYDMELVQGPGVNGSGVTAALVQEIQALHQYVGNVNVEGRYIVIGAGCTNLIAAASYAMYSVAGQALTMYAQPPYYQGYAGWASIFSAQTPFNSSLGLDPSTVLEFVTFPNNPTGTWRSPVYPTSPYLVYDCVYYWPSLVEIVTELDVDVALFSMSKLSGHAGTRLGWAVVKDKEVALAMSNFISSVTIGISIEAQWRSLNILRRINAEPSAFFPVIQATMLERWAQASAILTNETAYHIESVPGTFYLWIQCMNQSTSCCAQFASVNINGIPGPEMGASSDYCRLEMVLDDNTFQFLLQALQRLVGGGR